MTTRLDWFAFSIRFGCGAILGALVGMRIAVSTHSALIFWGSTLTCAVLIGAVSALYGRRFWELLRWYRIGD